MSFQDLQGHEYIPEHNICFKGDTPDINAPPCMAKTQIKERKPGIKKVHPVYIRQISAPKVHKGPDYDKGGSRDKAKYPISALYEADKKRSQYYHLHIYQYKIIYIAAVARKEIPNKCPPRIVDKGIEHRPYAIGDEYPKEPLLIEAGNIADTTLCKITGQKKKRPNRKIQERSDPYPIIITLITMDPHHCNDSNSPQELDPQTAILIHTTSFIQSIISKMILYAKLVR